MIKMETSSEHDRTRVRESPLLWDDYGLPDSVEEVEEDGLEYALHPQNPPPSLYTRPEHITRYKQISELRLQIEDDDLQPYLQQFDDHVHDNVLMVGSISLSEIQEEEQRLRDDEVANQAQEAELERRRKERLAQLEETAKLRIAHFARRQRNEIAQKQALLEQRERLLLSNIHKTFHHSEAQLTGVLQKRKAEVKTLYGDLVTLDGLYGATRGRRWKVDWERTPQPVQIRLSSLRGVRDKLPGGRYILMTSLYDRLGGHVLRWSRLKGQQWAAATMPTLHPGQFYNTEIKLEQSVFTSLPPKPSLRPGMVIVFELFLLRGNIVHTDRVVSWGCFPISDAQFDIVEGKYKCPMLRGEMDPRIDKHEIIEKLISSDVDHWLCNLYFQIVKLPRYLAGQTEYEVELAFTSGMLSFPDRVDEERDDGIDSDKPVPGSSTDVTSESSGSMSSLEKKKFDLDNVKPVAKVSEQIEPGAIERWPLGEATMFSSRKTHKEPALKFDDESDSDDDDYIGAIKRQAEFRRLPNIPNMYYKAYRSNPQDEYYKRVHTLLPKTGAIEKKKPLSSKQKLAQHQFTVRPLLQGRGHLAQNSQEKLAYVARQFLGEIGLAQWRSADFWAMIVMFLIVFFMRMFIHYIGEWVFLMALRTPINMFEFQAYTVNLNYQSSLLMAREEIFVVLIGPVMNILVFVLFMLFSWVCQKTFGLFPDLFSKFVFAYGILTFWDPLLCLIVDCILQRYQNLGGDIPIADFAKLYWHFHRTEGSGLAGIFITTFLYLLTGFIAATLLYIYFLRLHNNGRLLDIYWRLHGTEEQFFVPYDLEVSNQELDCIIRKSEQWRGDEGERRKITIQDFIWTDESKQSGKLLNILKLICQGAIVALGSNGFQSNIFNREEDTIENRARSKNTEVTTLVTIYTLHLDGLRQLHRQFLRIPEGALMEVFGDITIPGVNEDFKMSSETGGIDLHRPSKRDTQTTSTNQEIEYGEASEQRLETPPPPFEEKEKFL